MANPPYRAIYDKLMAGNVIPFLGAGAPLYDRNPKQTPWYERRAGKREISFLPTAGELATYLADNANPDVPAAEKNELTKMAQYYEAVVGTQDLHDNLREIFSYEQPPTPLHEFLAQIPAPLLIVTTNYDDLTERAFWKRDKPCDVVVHMTDQDKVLWWEHGRKTPEKVAAEDLLIDLEKVSVVYKMHGAIDRRPDETGHYVITEDDYIEYLTRMTRLTVIPPMFGRPFQKRSFLFLGYGLYDWNLRVILNRIQEFRGRPKSLSWAIETLNKPVERKLWERRGVEVFDGITLADFLTNLKAHGVDDQGDGPAAGGGS
jgi:hypothetical protein